MPSRDSTGEAVVSPALPQSSQGSLTPQRQHAPFMHPLLQITPTSAPFNLRHAAMKPGGHGHSDRCAGNSDLNPVFRVSDDAMALHSTTSNLYDVQVRAACPLPTTVIPAGTRCHSRDVPRPAGR